ncbi:MAG: hypothetical protein JWQ63_1430 [Mucilaginibacter sp.]|nr:hypothetical protein [Mucilaginibacter sp.]
MSTNRSISLVIFTCEGREHLLYDTINSFNKACDYQFSKIILAIDGPIKAEAIEYVNPDVVIQSPKRKGYVNSIINTLPAIDTSYFFWLEDDWEFPVEIPIDHFLGHLSSPGILQIILSKNPFENIYKAYTETLYLSPYGFSANPGICNTEFIKTGISTIKLLKNSEASPLTGFESVLNDYAKLNTLNTLYYFPNNEPTVNHSGDLESTAREYHMINSINKEKSLIGKEYISGFGYDRNISIKNKINMLFKLWLITLNISLKIWGSRKFYDFAFRIYLSHRNTLKR